MLLARRLRGGCCWHARLEPRSRAIRPAAVWRRSLAVAPTIGATSERRVSLCCCEVYAYDPTIPLDGRIVERVEKRDGPREKIVFRGAQGFYVPGYLQLPAQAATGPGAVRLLLHGWSGSKEHFWTDNNYISGGNVRRAPAGGRVRRLCARRPVPR